ncbi:hypothetical protein PHMEG_00022394 [Phytophthora megakarya]|uniref:SprT-like domain-containing protein n=1 Tax=Phytophthora megakarya TaxID=4795 RepID=A0A225VKH1_9STRA|nr:hypothetical protein PHMEG_00022394 [Phytophthora megakarya]
MSKIARAVVNARGDTLVTERCDLLAPENEYLDPNPDLHSLFLEYNRMFFEGRLAGCEVKWSKRMTLCAGLCSFQPRSGFCSIRLSEPLLKLRPRSDMVNTLLHEMIHAYVFVATPVRDHEDHGPLFQAHMHRINEAAKTKITVFHTFHDEVDSYRQHVWQCNGSCQRTAPYFGLVKRAMNRAPGPTDFWWPDHERKCGGIYIKIKEPAEFTAKQAKKMERELARAEKQKKKVKATPSVKQFFPTSKKDDDSTKVDDGDTNPPRAGKKALPQSKTGNKSNKKQKKEREGGGNNGWPILEFSPAIPVVFSADGDEDGYFLVGDIQALFRTHPPQPVISSLKLDRLEPSGDRRNSQGAFPGTNRISAVSGVVDLTVSDSEHSDSDQLERSSRASPPTLLQATTDESGGTTRTGEPHVIEIG